MDFGGLGKMPALLSNFDTIDVGSAPTAIQDLALEKSKFMCL